MGINKNYIEAKKNLNKAKDYVPASYSELANIALMSEKNVNDFLKLSEKAVERKYWFSLIDLTYFYLGEVSGYESYLKLEKANFYSDELISKGLAIGYFLKAKTNLLQNKNENLCELYKESFDGGYIGAGISLANEYLNGKNFKKNILEAFNLYNLIYNHSVGETKVLASHNLGYMYLNGVGVEKDLPKAREFLEFSAGNGLLESKNLLKSISAD